MKIILSIILFISFYCMIEFIIGVIYGIKIAKALTAIEKGKVNSALLKFPFIPYTVEYLIKYALKDKPFKAKVSRMKQDGRYYKITKID